MPSSAWAGWICFESEVEVEAAKDEPYRRSKIRAVQLSSEVYSSCGGEGLRCNVLYRRRSLNFQYSYCVKPLEILTSLWCTYTRHQQIVKILIFNNFEWRMITKNYFRKAFFIMLAILPSNCFLVS